MISKLVIGGAVLLFLLVAGYTFIYEPYFNPQDGNGYNLDTDYIGEKDGKEYYLTVEHNGNLERALKYILSENGEVINYEFKIHAVTVYWYKEANA